MTPVQIFVKLTFSSVENMLRVIPLLREAFPKEAIEGSAQGGLWLYEMSDFQGSTFCMTLTSDTQVAPLMEATDGRLQSAQLVITYLPR